MDTPKTPASANPAPGSGAPGRPETAAAGFAGPPGRPSPVGVAGRLLRFVVAERVSHWLYAFFFFVALVSGLLTWIPATREWLGGSRYAFSQSHGYVGAAMVILPLLLLFVLDRRRLARDVREVDQWSWDDQRWFWLALRGYTVRGKEMPPQGRFNAGQKFNAILVAAMALGFAATGGILMHRADMPAWLVSRALWLHGILAIVAVALFLGHLAHVVLTRHGRDYLQGMIGGTISEDLAQKRHRRWWEQETGSDETGTAETGPDETGTVEAGGRL